MKKFVLALLVGIMTVATASIAVAEVTVGGKMVTRYETWSNLNLQEGADSYTNQNFFANRVLLNVNAKLADGVEALIELDGATDRWGLDPQYTTNLATYLNHNDKSLSIRQAWMNFMIPGLPIGMKVGHQPLALGHGIWLDTSRYGSDAILLYSKPMPELLLAAAFVKGAEAFGFAPARANIANRYGGGAFVAPGQTPTGSTPGAGSRSTSDADFYAALANYTWCENNTVGVNFTFVSDNATIGAPGSATATRDGDITATNTALVFDGVLSGITYKGEFDWLHVNVESILANTKDYQIDAYAAMLGGSMKFSNVTVGLETAYGSGNNRSDVNLFYNPGSGSVVATTLNTAGNAADMDHAYYTPYNSTSYNYAYLYNDKIGQGPLGSGGGLGFGDGFGGIGLANTFYVKLSGGMPVTEKVKVDMDVLYLSAAKTMTHAQSHDLGWEIDGHVGYELYSNLKFDLNGGYLFTGDYYEFEGHENSFASTITQDGTSSGKLKTDDAWGATAKLTVKF
ncbi:MAG: hypothetical protein HZA22_02580 [Nitrospirae bacterium]|nr:hypothetical protein [Nitrospirota bacterium]